MSRQVLGKRSHSSFSSPSPSRSPTPAPKSRRVSVALEPPSPDPTPNPKRVKASPTETEEDDHGSNKENIPPEPIPGSPNTSDDATNSSTDASTSTTTMTARDLRASRRASTTTTRSTTTRRRVSVSRTQSATSSATQTLPSPPVSRRISRSQTATETPSKSMARLTLVTPPPTPVSIPQLTSNDRTSSKPSSPHTLGRALLRPQANGAAPLVGREQERRQILDFLEPFIREEACLDDITSLYVSGAPGTGKTALINEVLASVALQDTDAMNVDNACLRVVYVNCMTLSAKDGMTGVWEHCLEQLGGEKAKKRGPTTKIDWCERFGNFLRDQKCILVLDEIDHLAALTSASISIAQIFAIASAPQTRTCLRVIGISNTHTLTHATSSSHSQTVHFQPYTAAQMKAVLSKRLECLSASGFDTTKVFPASTIALLTFKIANETGDIRTVFSVARRALDLAAVGSEASSSISVTPAHVLAALKASNASMNTSQSKRDGAQTVTRVRNLGLHSRFALAALLLATKRIVAGLSLASSGSNTSSGKFKENHSPPSSVLGRDNVAPVIEVTALHGFYVAILSRGAYAAFHGVGRTEFGDLVGLLEGNGLVEVTQGRGFGNKTKSPTKGKGTQVVSIARGVLEEELVRGLVGSVASVVAEDSSVNVSEEEVKHVWEREIGRLEREVKAKFGNATKNKADFEGAEED